MEKLQEEKNTEIDEFQEEHAEFKFKQNQDIKKRYNIKIALAQKQGDQDQLKSL